jgi:serine protease SohB
MLDTLLQFCLFLAETAIIVIAILVIFAGVAAIVTKGKIKKEQIRLRKLNSHYDDIKDAINAEILSEDEYKKYRKAQKQLEKKKAKKKKKINRGFIINFDGDIKASELNSLREEVTAILTIAKPEDEVIVRLESTGGLIHSYGLAASQLQRIKDKNIPLIIAVDKAAASGGYMMACIANTILSAPFAIIGSIGVLAQLPNFNKLLKKHNIDFEQITAGEYKRTLTIFGENTPEGRKKFQEEIDEAHKLFKDLIQQHRPQLDLEKVATGEYWFGTRALELNLVDKLITSDDYLLQASKDRDLFEITYEKKKTLREKLATHGDSALKTLKNKFNLL